MGFHNDHRKVLLSLLEVGLNDEKQRAILQAGPVEETPTQRERPEVGEADETTCRRPSISLHREETFHTSKVLSTKERILKGFVPRITKW